MKPHNDNIPHGFCQCGCGQLSPVAPYNNRSRGWVRGIPQSYIHGHSTRTRIKVTADKYSIDSVTGCWEWIGAKQKCGYGTVGLNGKILLAHRVSWTEHRGEIPEGMEIDHLCRNRACVNPEHLEPVTPMVNMQRGSRAKLTPELVQAIRENAEGLMQKEWAQRLGLHRCTIMCVVNRKTWPNIP